MTKVYARVVRGIVHEIYVQPEIHAKFTLKQLFTPAICGQMIDITDLKPRPKLRWSTTDHGLTFQPPHGER